MAFVEVAETFVGKGSLAIGGRSFKTTGAKLYCYWVDCRGLYELSYCRLLALVKGENKVSGAYTGGAYVDRAAY